MIAYKGNRYFLVGGDSGPEFGVDTWANGKKGSGLQGTWVDAEDGVLGRNPMAAVSRQAAGRAAA